MKLKNITIKLIFKTFDKKAKNDIIIKKISFWHKKNCRNKKICLIIFLSKKGFLYIFYII